MQLLYATTNQGKLAAMKRSLAVIPQLSLVGLRDMDKPWPLVEETGATLLENAREKAKAYYDTYQMPVFSCDTGLYLEGIPQELQPGIHVRNMNGRCLSDEEMTEYYGGLARTYGDLRAQYRHAVCLILQDGRCLESQDEKLWAPPFLLTGIPCPGPSQPGFPLDCLSKDLTTGRYFYEIGSNVQDKLAVWPGIIAFFQEALSKI